MKIVYLHQYFATKESTTSTRSYVIAKKLVEKGHEVYMITTDAFLQNHVPYEEKKHAKYYLIDGIHIIAQKNSYSNHMNNFRRIKSFLSFLSFAYKQSVQVKDVDVLYSTSTPLTIAIPTLFIHKKLKKPFVFEVRDLWPEAPRQMGVIRDGLIFKVLKWLERKTYHSASHIVSLSPGMTEGILEEDIAEEKVSMVPNFADLRLFQEEQDEKEHQQLVEKYKLQDKFVLLHLGAMGEANGLDYIMKAAKSLKQRGETKIQIVIGGDGKTKQDLMNYCEEHDLSNVTFLGYIPRKKIPMYTRLANVTMTCFKPLPILATNSPNKFFDSLAAGKPIIVNSDGWTKDIVKTKYVGYHVDPATPNHLAELLIAIQHDEKRLEQMAPQIRKLAETDYNSERLSDQIEQILVRTVWKEQN